MYACLAVTCHLHFWQNDRDFLRATVVTRGWNGYRNKSQHRKSTLEKKILPPFQQGFEPATFQSRVRCSNHWAIPAPALTGKRRRRRRVVNQIVTMNSTHGLLRQGRPIPTLGCSTSQICMDPSPPAATRMFSLFSAHVTSNSPSLNSNAWTGLRPSCTMSRTNKVPPPGDRKNRLRRGGNL